MRFFPNLETEEGRALAAQQQDAPVTQPSNPVDEWQRAFTEALSAGDKAGAIQTDTEYDYELCEYRQKPAFTEAMYDFHIAGRDQRIDWAQAQYLRALAQAAGQSVTEAHELGRKMDGLGSALADGLRELTGQVADPLGQLAAWAADRGDTQEKILGALELIAGHLCAVNVRADLAESKAVADAELGRNAELAKARRRADAVRDLRAGLAALAWWQWLRRRRIERQLVGLALELVD